MIRDVRMRLYLLLDIQQIPQTWQSLCELDPSYLLSYGLAQLDISQLEEGCVP